MTANSHSRPTAAWLDPAAGPTADQTASIQALGWNLVRVDDLTALAALLGEVKLLILRLQDDSQMLEEVQDFLASLSRPMPVVCRVHRGEVGLAVAAMRMGASHVESTDEWRPQEWLPSAGTQRPASTSSTRSVVFVDPLSQQLLNLARKVAQTEVTALLTGPTGAGKEVLARVLHEASRRAGGPFVSLNCGALPEHLVEDMLFGHDKGAFSGAIRDHKGLFEQAQGGTVFLDEIGEMPMHLQTRLLRVLQERCVTRLGGSRPIPVNVRVITATNKNLKQAIVDREFREDLYFRISTFSLRVPPLCERPQDIVPLVAHFLQQYGRPEIAYRLSEEARRLLVRHPWPGNVRELENVIQRAIVLTGDDLIRPEHVMFDEPTNAAQATSVQSVLDPQEAGDFVIDPAPTQETVLQEEHAVPMTSGYAVSTAAPVRDHDAVTWQEARPPIGSASVLSDGTDLHTAVRSSERLVIMEAIRTTPSREAAAKKLGISPRTLRYKIAQLRQMGMGLSEAMAE